VVGDGALGALDGTGQLRDCRSPLVQQPEDGRTERVADRPYLLGSGELDRLGEVVVRRGIARRDWISLASPIVPDIWFIEDRK
jgi:hypothetical protein